MTQGNQEHRYVGTTDEGLLPESVEELRGMQEFWQKQVPMNGRTVADSVHDEIEIVPGKVTCEQHCQKNGSKEQIVYVSPYLRAKQTADILFPDAGKVEIAEFAECRFGDFEYKNYAGIKWQSRLPALHRQRRYDGVPGGWRQKRSLQTV